MLKVEKLAPPAAASVEVSDGPILYVTIEGLEEDRTLWWRAVPSNGSLCEIGFLAWSGVLAHLTLVIVDKQDIRIAEELDLLGQGLENLPVFDKNPWPPDTHHMTTAVDYRLQFIDEPVPLDLAISSSGLSLLLNGPCTIAEVLSLDRIRLGLDEARNLRRVDVVKLTDDELRAVREITKKVLVLEGDRAPGRIAGRDFLGDRLRGQIDDRNVVRRTIRRI